MSDGIDVPVVGDAVAHAVAPAPVARRTRAAGAIGAAAGVALAAVFAWAGDRAPAAAPGGAGAVARPAPTPAAAWQPLVDLLVASAVDGDALVVVEDGTGIGALARGGDVARTVADAVAAAPGGPRLAFADTLPRTAAAAANRLARPLAARRAWVAWPAALAAASPPDDDPVRAWLDAHGQQVVAVDVGGRGDSSDAGRAGDAGDADGAGAARGARGAAWTVGAWQHPPSLDGGDYPPVVVPEALGALELVGWSIAPRPLRAGRAGRIRAAWRVGRDGAADVRIVFRLVDAAGRTAAAFGDPPALRLAPPSSWPAADITVIDHDFTVPPDVPAGAYDVVVEVGGAQGVARVIGAVAVAAPGAARPDGE